MGRTILAYTAFALAMICAFEVVRNDCDHMGL